MITMTTTTVTKMYCLPVARNGALYREVLVLAHDIDEAWLYAAELLESGESLF